VLNEEQRLRLLRLARTSIESTLEGRSAEVRAEDYDEELRRPAGAFVTLRKNGDLRGCIGSIHAMEPLYRAVATSAVSAAFRDPRFFPVRKDEMGLLELEISVMGPIETVSDITQIEVGRDGLIIKRAQFAGLLLPQVASEYGWDRETFLDQTCLKAGLPPGSWRQADTRIEKFAAEVFGE
jgi:AmmeMemoRadiSam system protein A